VSVFRELSFACAAYVATYMLEIPHAIKIIIIIIIIMINVTILQIGIAVKMQYKIILLLTVVSKQLRFICSSNEASSALVRPLPCVRAVNPCTLL
jgi:hypothetical protein